MSTPAYLDRVFTDLNDGADLIESTRVFGYQGSAQPVEVKRALTVAEVQACYASADDQCREIVAELESRATIGEVQGQPILDTPMLCGLLESRLQDALRSLVVAKVEGRAK